ncbi:HalOD1 output domain-containing protein [Haladaptatus pallidirubidus]|uniref:Halobacterial output domain-containing protein n=1 Tax=Haladaptatus pallidirubidus TaxID=1008152 RepID=A0AAV3ULE6_9EURY|nr:HalOD1 output domain-containing protein [Haladaptatus pallidirubidus]
MNERANTVETPITDGRVSEAVIHAISRVNGVDPLELDSPLYDTIDPDALDRLFQPTPTAARDIKSSVSFTVAGCEVTITDNRVVAAKRLSPVDT